MSDLATLTSSLLAKAGQDYLTEFTAWASKIRDDLASFSAALLSAVTATSTTSAAIQTGQQTIAVQTGKSFSVGMPITIAKDSANLMYGKVDSYSPGSGALQFSVEDGNDLRGGGTYASWTVTLRGSEGPAGPTWLNPALRTAGYVMAASDWAWVKLAATADFTLPAGPVSPVLMRLTDIAGNFATLRPRLLRNGQTIMGLAEDMTLETNRGDYWIFFADGTWQVVRSNA